jgi:hypothetical protein
MLLIGLYVAGFLVVSLHNATYGIIEFGLFRAKLLSTGILFAVFLAIPFWEASRFFNMFVFRRSTVPAEGASSEQTKQLKISPTANWLIRILLFFAASWSTAMLIKPIFGDYEYRGADIASAFGFIVIATLVILFTHLSYPKNQRIGATLAVVALLLGLGAIIYLKDWYSLRMLAWFCLVGYWAHRTEPSMRRPRSLLDLSVPIVLVDILALFGFFGYQLYPRIAPLLGGGRPSEITLQFAISSPINNASKTQVWLVDEVDDGYYVLGARDDHKAIFIPRSLVSAVYFEQDK